jgi:hypothetical protein
MDCDSKDTNNTKDTTPVTKQDIATLFTEFRQILKTDVGFWQNKNESAISRISDRVDDLESKKITKYIIDQIWWWTVFPALIIYTSKMR